MNETHFHDDHRHLVLNRTDSYRRRGDEWQKAVLLYAVVGATSLFTTAEDLAKWQANFELRRLGSDAVFARVFQRGTLTNGDEIIYAGGLYYGQLGDVETIGHSGGDAAYRCHVARFPKQKLSVAVLANAGNVPVQQLAHRIGALYLNSEAGNGDERKPVGGTNDPHGTQPQAAGLAENWGTHNAYGNDNESFSVEAAQTANEEFVGRYYSQELDANFDFELDSSGELTMRRRKYGSQPCQPLSTDRFRVNSGLLLSVKFRRHSETEAVTHLLLSSSRVKDVRFERVHGNDQ